MSKKEKAKNKQTINNADVEKKHQNNSARAEVCSLYVYRMKNAEEFDATVSIVWMIPVIIFAAVIIMMARLHFYQRPMSQFFWTTYKDTTMISDYFSYNKMRFIIAVTCFAIILLFASLVKESFSIKRSVIYVPMAVYAVFVIISYIGSKYKDFALLGFNDRFEGTIPLLCYMIMLFYVINNLNSEKDFRLIFRAVAVMSVVLGVHGIMQAAGHDFFLTELGQKIMCPNTKLPNGTTIWEAIESSFAEGHPYFGMQVTNGIGQTVYNPNYVSFYLSMLVPFFGMMFLRSLLKESGEPVWKKLCLAALLALLVFNMLASKSAGGFLGLGCALVLAIITLNKQLKLFWKPIAVIVIAAAILLGATSSMWLPELKNTLSSAGSVQTKIGQVTNPNYGANRPYIDYIKTGETIEFSINGEPLILDYYETEDDLLIAAFDSEGNKLGLTMESEGYLSVDDERFYPFVKLNMSYDTDGHLYLVLTTNNSDIWYFTDVDGIKYYVNSFGRMTEIGEIEHSGFENNPDFGTGRGFTWSRTIPLLRHTIIKGYGADTFAIYFPQNDYAGKYNTKTYGWNKDILIDKAHNMYLHSAIGTGLISTIALITMYGIYVVQSFRLFFRRDLGCDYLNYAGVGLFLGLTAFMISGLVNDSSVSVMPLFYSMLGAGISLNMLIRYRDQNNNAV